MFFIVDFSKIESKWQAKWERESVFEAKRGNKQKWFMVFAYPTASGSLHVGHCRSYTLPDVIARYKRMNGFDVFFPLGFHATGVDTLRILRDLKNDIKNAKKYGLGENISKTFETPLDVEKALEENMIESFKMLGLSLDYSAVVSTIHPQYNKFIQWQFRKLRELGYLVQKDYRVPWCPNCNHPVSLDSAQADLSEGGDASIKEYTIIKFKGDRVYPVSTLRPETVFGVTNLWVHPGATYVLAKVDGEEWVVSKESVQKLQNLGKYVEEEMEVKGEELIGKKVKNPLTSQEVEILEGTFVDSNEATGVVMSVPSHDPFDYIYLKKVAPRTEPIQVLEIEGYGKAPAAEVLKKFSIDDPKDERIENALKTLYNLELKGKMLKSIKFFGGMPTVQAREAVKEYMEKNKLKDIIYEFSKKPVICRFGGDIIIKAVKGQWFIDYSSKRWKSLAKKCIEAMDIYPPEYKTELPQIIDWLSFRPCVRKTGLGTEFPFEEGWVIEPLSDSTIYMAFYIISKFFNEGKIKLENLTGELFDYVVLGKGEPGTVVKVSGVKKQVLEEIRKDLEYWYPLDLNCGGKEHKSVHFPFFIFNHAGILDEKFWPKGIFVNWHVLAYGEKMSKSKGNVIFWHDAIRKYGADPVRLYLCNGAYQWSDFDWKNEECEVYARHLSNFYNTIEHLSKNKAKERRPIDRWLESRVNRVVKEVTEYMEGGEIKRAIDAAFFKLMNDIAWYRKRISSYNVEDVLPLWIKILSPFVPHISEELWGKLGKKGLLSQESWPEYDPKLIDLKVEAEEDLIKAIIKDIEEIKKLSKISKPEKIAIFVSPAWKYEVYNMALQGKALKDIMSQEKFRNLGKSVQDYYSKLQKRKPLEEIFLTASAETNALRNAKDFLESQTSSKIEIVSAEKSDSPKAKAAEPGKPGIVVE